MQKEFEGAGYKATRMVLKAEVERTRVEVQRKISKRLSEIMKQEEENVKTLNGGDYPVGELDEEFMMELQAAANGEFKNSGNNQPVEEVKKQKIGNGEQDVRTEYVPEESTDSFDSNNQRKEKKFKEKKGEGSKMLMAVLDQVLGKDKQ